jgi:hypothetical protein
VADTEIEPKHSTETMKRFNETVANPPQLESILIPIGDGLTVSRVKNLIHSLIIVKIKINAYKTLVKY